MKIVFFPVDCTPFHGKTLQERPLGGTETAVIHLAEALDALGQEVVVLSQLAVLPSTRPLYRSISQINNLGPFDLLIVIRGLKGLMHPFSCRRRFFWTGDAYDNMHTFGLGDHRLMRQIDLVLSVSEWHADTLSKFSGFPREKMYVLRNGICLHDFQGEEKRNSQRLIYSSSPLRGLRYLSDIFLQLKRHHADLELVIFSSESVYRPEWPPINVTEGESRALFNHLRTLPDCHIFSPLPQRQLAREFMKSAIWAYPTRFEETSCITALEAQAAGAVPVTSYLAALPETVGEAGILISGQAGTKAYQDQFVKACQQLLSDEPYMQKLSQCGRERSLNFDWHVRAKNFLTFVQEKFFK